MPLDGLYLYSTVTELKNKILNCKVDKINQPEKDEIILSIRGFKENLKLLISASSVYPKIHLTSCSKPNPTVAPLFCMILRKYLTSAKIIEINQIDTDRVVIINFENTDEFGFNSIYSLIVEIMGRHSNITLVRQRDNIIVDSIKHVTPEINTYRCLYPGIEFVFPPKSNKLNPFSFSFEDMKSYILDNNIEYNNKFFANLFTGISNPSSKEIFYRIQQKNIKFEAPLLHEIYNIFQNTISLFKNNDYSFASYSNNGTVKDFYCIEFTYLCEYEAKQFDTSSILLQEFYLEKDKADRLNSRSINLQKIISNNLDRCTKKIKILEETLDECRDKDSYKIYGELLTANIYNIKKGDKSVHLLNYYLEGENYIDINVDEFKSPSENIQRYFKKYNKLKKSEEMASVQLKNAQEEYDYLQSVFTNLKNADNYNDIEEIKRELTETGYIRNKTKDKKKIKLKISKPLHFISSDGIDLYVGKNNYQNDYLTLKFADKHDLWLHTKNIPGSHVIIKKYGEIPERTLEEAAKLAAYYSKSKDSSKVPVDYTEVKNIKKPSGAKPGMVIYYTNKTVYVSPEKLDLKSI
ncbi:MAG: NFACT RNA binding domain-containing protein [Bacillota bacterium]|nr:NFACT RNA binding domain-containing protein [Bacillota bacterium]